MHWLLTYRVVDDYAERRMPFRDEHLALAWSAHARGELVLGGALEDPVDSALLVFAGRALLRRCGGRSISPYGAGWIS